MSTATLAPLTPPKWPSFFPPPSAEQQVVEFDGILTDQRVEQVGQRKYDVKVASRQQFVLPSSDPSLTGLSLALGTMAVTTTNGDLSISCRNRHCPKCQTNAREKWLRARQRELLPVGYYHLVFSVPHSLVPLIWQNKKVLFALLFEASASTLLEVAADPKHLGADIGFLSILHTWGQTLQRHPHIHCVVPGGGLSPDHTRWITSRSR